MIQSQSIRPGADFHVFEDRVPPASAHWCRLDAGKSSIPVGPEEDPWRRNTKTTIIMMTIIIITKMFFPPVAHKGWFKNKSKKTCNGPTKKEALRPLKRQHVGLCFSVLLHDRNHQRSAADGLYTDAGQRQRRPSDSLEMGRPSAPLWLSFHSSLMPEHENHCRTLTLTRVQPAKQHLRPAAHHEVGRTDGRKMGAQA